MQKMDTDSILKPEKMEETILSSSYNTPNSNVESQSPADYQDFCEDIEEDKTINSTMIEDFTTNIEISPSQIDLSKLETDVNMSTDRSMLALGPRISWQHSQNTYVRPIKSFWWRSSTEPTLPEVGFHQKDDIFRELQCNSCSYTTFQKNQIKNHIKKWHQLGNSHSRSLIQPVRFTPQETKEICEKLQIRTPLQPESNFENKETTAVRLNSRSIKERDAFTATTVEGGQRRDKKGNRTEKKIVSFQENYGAGFQMKDPVSRELKCNTCGFETFSKKQMQTHVNRHTEYTNVGNSTKIMLSVCEDTEDKSSILPSINAKVKCKIATMNKCDASYTHHPVNTMSINEKKQKEPEDGGSTPMEESKILDLGNTNEHYNYQTTNKVKPDVLEPIKLSKANDGKDINSYFQMKDPVSKELRCNICAFESFSKKNMIMHVNRLHLMTMNDHNDYQMTNKIKPDVLEPIKLSKANAEKDIKSCFQMKDPVSKELRCNICAYESFSKKKMILHVNKLHLTTDDQKQALPIINEELALKNKYLERGLVSDANNTTQENVIRDDDFKNLPTHSNISLYSIKSVDENRNILIPNKVEQNGSIIDIKCSASGTNTLTLNNMQQNKATNDKNSSIIETCSSLNKFDSDGLKEFMEIVASSSFDESDILMSKIDDEICLDEDLNASTAQNNNKRVHFDEEILKTEPKRQRRMVSPEYRAMEDSF